MASTGSTTSPYGYAGDWGYRTEGDAGLMHVGARYYDAQVARFVSRDTYLDQHPYLYCEHDGVNWVDPSGHGPVNWKEVGHWCWTGGWGLIGGVVGEVIGGGIGGGFGGITVPVVGAIPGTVIGAGIGVVIGGTAGIGFGEITWQLWFK